MGKSENQSETKTLAEIQEKIDRGDVVVMTASEVCDWVRRGKTVSLQDVDVVTSATCAVMSGTYAVLSFKVAEPDTFIRARKVWLNGVPAQVGPCPNERIGILDLIVIGTAESKTNPNYGGGHLFRELVECKPIAVEIETIDGKRLSATTTIKDIPLAMLYATRNAFKNYLAFVNPGDDGLKSIFHTDDFKGNLSELTFCGCGEINPLENDPGLETIGIGSKVLFNGAEGFVSGPGTRSSPEKPNLAGFADLHKMNPKYLGGFITGMGPDLVNTWAVPIPVLNREILENILRTDDDIKLKVVDVRNRIPLYEITYGDVWNDTDQSVRYDAQKCLRCDICQVEQTCPVGAVTYEPTRPAVHDKSICFNCGTCVSRCDGEAFIAELGTVICKDEAGKKSIPVALRQSNRAMAREAAMELKEKILDKRFTLTAPVSKITFG